VLRVAEEVLACLKEGQDTKDDSQRENRTGGAGLNSSEEKDLCGLYIWLE